MLPPADAPVVQAPQLGPLPLRLPLAKLVAKRQYALLRPRTLLIAPRAPERAIEPMLCDRVQKRHGLQAVARSAWTCLIDDPPLVDRVLHARHDQPLADLRDPPVTELNRLGEVVARVHMHDRKREAPRTKRLLRQPQQNDRVLPPGEQQNRPLELGGGLAQHMNRLGLEGAQMGEVVGGGHPCWRLPDYFRGARCARRTRLDTPTTNDNRSFRLAQRLFRTAA